MKPPSKCRQMPAKSFTIAEAAEKNSSLSRVTAVCSALTAQCRVRQSRKIKFVVLEAAYVRYWHLADMSRCTAHDRFQG